MRKALAGVLLPVALLTGGCAGAGDEATGEPPASAAAPARVGSPDAGPGRVVLRFVRAALRGDAPTMWSLLSRATRETMGTNVHGFQARGNARAFAKQFKGVTGERVVLSRRLDARVGVGAIAGRVEEDDEDYAFAAAVVREGGRWRLELGGIVIAVVEPGDGDTTGDRPRVAARAESPAGVGRVLVWVDTRPLPFQRTEELPFTATITSRPPAPLSEGVHYVVVFASNRESAGAAAWPFSVQD